MQQRSSCAREIELCFLHCYAVLKLLAPQCPLQLRLGHAHCNGLKQLAMLKALNALIASLLKILHKQQFPNVLFPFGARAVLPVPGWPAIRTARPAIFSSCTGCFHFGLHRENQYALHLDHGQNHARSSPAIVKESKGARYVLVLFYSAIPQAAWLRFGQPCPVPGRQHVGASLV